MIMLKFNSATEKEILTLDFRQKAISNPTTGEDQAARPGLTLRHVVSRQSTES